MLWSFQFRGMYSNVQDDCISSIRKIRISALSLKVHQPLRAPLSRLHKFLLAQRPHNGCYLEDVRHFWKDMSLWRHNKQELIIEFCLNVWEFLVVPKPVQTARQETIKGKWKVGTSPSRIRGWNGTFPDKKKKNAGLFSLACSRTCLQLGNQEGTTRKMWKFPLYLNFRYGSKAQTVRDSSVKNKNLEKHCYVESSSLIAWWYCNPRKWGCFFFRVIFTSLCFRLRFGRDFFRPDFAPL